MYAHNPDADARMSPDRELYRHPELEAGGARSAFSTALVVQMIAVVRKRKWWIASAVAASLLAGFVITLLMTPLYTATATLEIQRERQNFTQVQGAETQPQATFDPEYYQTQYGLLKARSLAQRVAVGLRLPDSQEFYETVGSGLATAWFADGKLISNASTKEQRERVAADILLANLSVKPERMSRLVEISFSSPNAAFSKRVVDAWASHFIEAALQRRFETTSYARKFLQDRLSQLRQRIDESERQLVSYAQQEGIITLPSEARADSGPTERSLALDDLATLNRELARVSAERIQAESRLGGLAGANEESLNNTAIASMRSSQADLSAQYAKLMTQFEPSYPPAKALQNQISQLNRSIAAEENRVRNSIQETYRALKDREERLAARLEVLKGGVLDQRRRSIQYNVIQREVDTNRQLYDALLQRYKEIGIAGGVGVNNISIVDNAKLPRGPSSPNLPRNLAVALLLGLALGAGIALLLEQLNDSVDDPREISEVLGVPMLGTVPKSSDDIVVEKLRDPKEMISEAYFSLRTSLAFTTDHGFPRSLAFTSSRPGEGKSTSSYAVASSLARPERRVLLIDADMRSPSLHSMFDMSGGSGLSNYLSGSDDVASLIHKTAQDGLYLLPAGPQPPSAADLLSGDRFGQLIALLLEEFDHVIVDAPPVMGLADAPLIASHVEGTVFVIEAHTTNKGVIRVAMSRLMAARVRMLGVIVSKFDTKRANYGYGYSYGYGYGYGDRANV